MPRALFVFAVYVEVEQGELDTFEEDGGAESVAEEIRKEGGEFADGEVLGVDIVCRTDLEEENPRPALADLGLDLEQLGMG